jgi:hypothetical protein
MTQKQSVTFSDKKATYIFSLSLLALLLLAVFIPTGNGRIACAALLLPAAVIASVFKKKDVCFPSVRGRYC